VLATLRSCEFHNPTLAGPIARHNRSPPPGEECESEVPIAVGPPCIRTTRAVDRRETVELAVAIAPTQQRHSA